MGYYMSLVGSSFEVTDETAAAEAIKTLGRGSWTDAVADDATFTQALEAWRWAYDTEMKTLEFNGEKYGDEDKLWKAIAPYVVNGSYIEMRGEDDSQWRWVFVDGAVRQTDGLCVFEPMPYAELVEAIDALLAIRGARARANAAEELKERAASGVGPR